MRDIWEQRRGEVAGRGAGEGCGKLKTADLKVRTHQFYEIRWLGSMEREF